MKKILFKLWIILILAVAFILPVAKIAYSIGDKGGPVT